MSDKRFLHFNDKGEIVNLSGKCKDNRQGKSDYQRMIERWHQAIKGRRLTANGKHD